MCNFYIVKTVDDSPDKLKIVSKYTYNPAGFARLGSILARFGFFYYRDYDSVKVYTNSIERKIGDIINIDLKNEENNLPRLYKEYKSDVSYGDYFDNMLIELTKSKKEFLL